jgi:RHS repeat-associated protein
MGTYQVSVVGYSVNIQPAEVNLRFAGRLIKAGADWVVTDRLGSVAKRGSERLRYFPWGEEQSTTTQNRDKFGTYYRDSTGLDYAMNRYYSSQHGRFLTADPALATNAPVLPQNWNRYAYVGGDPVNKTDPRGLCSPNDDPPCYSVTGTARGDPTPSGGTRGSGDPGGSDGMEVVADSLDGGGSTGGQGSGFIHVTNPSKAGPNQERTRNVMTWIEQNVDDDCADWLAGLGDAIAGLLGNPDDERTVIIGHGAFDTRKIAAFVNNNPNQTDLPAGYGMTLNDLGAFFVGSYTENGQTYSLSANGYTGGTSQAQVAILLHELAHTLNAQGFQSDFNSDSAGAANDRLVRQHCQRTLDEARNIR